MLRQMTDRIESRFVKGKNYFQFMASGLVNEMLGFCKFGPIDPNLQKDVICPRLREEVLQEEGEGCYNLLDRFLEEQDLWTAQLCNFCGFRKMCQHQEAFPYIPGKS